MYRHFYTARVAPFERAWKTFSEYPVDKNKFFEKKFETGSYLIICVQCALLNHVEHAQLVSVNVESVTNHVIDSKEGCFYYTNDIYCKLQFVTIIDMNIKQIFFKVSLGKSLAQLGKTQFSETPQLWKAYT